MKLAQTKYIFCPFFQLKVCMRCKLCLSVPVQTRPPGLYLLPDQSRSPSLRSLGKETEALG